MVKWYCASIFWLKKEHGITFFHSIPGIFFYSRLKILEKDELDSESSKKLFLWFSPFINKAIRLSIGQKMFYYLPHFEALWLASGAITFFISKKRELLARAKSSHKWHLQYCCKYYMSLQIKARQMMAAHQRTT